MTLRKLVTVLPVIAVLALTGPVAGASAQTRFRPPASPRLVDPVLPVPGVVHPGRPGLDAVAVRVPVPDRAARAPRFELPVASATPSPTATPSP